MIGFSLIGDKDLDKDFDSFEKHIAFLNIAFKGNNIYSDDQQYLREYVHSHPEAVEKLPEECLLGLVKALSRPTSKPPRRLPNGRVIDQPTERRLIAVVCMIKCRLHGGTFSQHVQMLTTSKSIVKPEPYESTLDLLNEFIMKCLKVFFRTGRPSNFTYESMENALKQGGIINTYLNDLGLTLDMLLDEWIKLKSISKS